MYDYKVIEKLALKTTNIKGKEYVEVNERIKAFREACPLGSITTEFIEIDAEWCVIKATVSDDDGRILGTGLAFETKQASYINKTSYVENCETSAVGRALGMLGIGIDASVCSKDELEHAIEYQEQIKTEEKPISSANVATLKAALNALGVSDEDRAKLLNKYKVTDYDKLTHGQYGTIMNQLKKRIEEKEKKQNEH